MKTVLFLTVLFLSFALSRGLFAADKWVETGPSLIGRSNHAAIKLSDGKVLVVGGRQSNVLAGGILRTAEIFDPSTKQWTATGSLNTGRELLDAILLNNGRVLIVGGQVGKNSSPSASTETFDPATGRFQLGEVMNQPRKDLRAIKLNDGRVLAVGGSLDATAEIYDSSTGLWNLTTNMISPRTKHSAILLKDGRVLVTGGGPDPKSAEIYDPKTNRWTDVRSMSAPRHDHTSTLLEDGRVLVVGGEGLAARSAEIFDPSKNSWSTTAPLPLGLTLHTAARLLDGKVIVTGGYTQGDASAQFSGATLIFDPAKNQWKQGPSMRYPRALHASAVLNDGRLLVIAGRGLSGNSEIYEP